MDEINKLFARISSKLYQHSLNYCANFKMFPCGAKQNDSLEQLVQTTFGENAVVDSACVVTQQEVIDELRNALAYRGDQGSHPSLDYLGSSESKNDFDLVLANIQSMLDRSSRIVAFCLREGHPFYPVFWDFAFLIQTDDESILFIASSSD